MEFFPYLFFSLAFLFLFTVGFFLTPMKFRPSVLLSALLSAPTSLATFVFVPYYWNPKRIVPFELGPEDIFFSFSTGGIVWLIVILYLTRNYNIIITQKIKLMRYGIFVIIGCLIYMVCLLSKMRIMLSTVITVCILGTPILMKRWNYWKLCLIGASGFIIVYVAFLKGFLTVYPEFIEHWSLEYLYGITLIGLPVEEIMWAAVTGAVWPLIMSQLFNLQIVKKKESSMP